MRTDLTCRFACAGETNGCARMGANVSRMLKFVWAGESRTVRTDPTKTPRSACKVGCAQKTRFTLEVRTWVRFGLPTPSLTK